MRAAERRARGSPGGCWGWDLGRRGIRGAGCSEDDGAVLAAEAAAAVASRVTEGGIPAAAISLPAAAAAAVAAASVSGTIMSA